ncbi:hypothetical protein ABK040_000785 [Willaertia magna]
MPEYSIRGVTVNFPYQAYNCQELYMEKVIQCLQESMQEKQEKGTSYICSKNALLESPTGTGKTMSLICSSYAWLLDYKKKANGFGPFPKIIFTSRTHSQLTHAIKEVKRSAYLPEIAVLGSREQLCINPDVNSLKGFQQISKCSSLVRSSGCQFYNKFNEMKKDGTLLLHEKEDEVEDIEDLLSKGLRKGFCPFFHAREAQKQAEIIFMPYNYLIDPMLRKKVNVDISNSILIFDEAHNIQKLCAEASSFDFSTINICKAIAEVEKCRLDLDNFTLDLESISRSADLRSDCHEVNDALLDLDIYLDDMKVNDNGNTMEGDSIFEIFAQAAIHPSTWENFVSKIRNIINYLQTKKLPCSGLERVKDAVERLFSGTNTEEVYKNYFKVHIYAKKQSGNLSSEHLQLYSDVLGTRDKKKDFRKSKTLSFWCFNPGISMKALAAEGPLALILTSGTLSPMEGYAYELGLNFPIRLENPHVVNKDQVCIIAAQNGPTGIKLNSSFNNRSSDGYLKELGGMLCNLSRIVPDGLLVFFPSYSLMDQCTDNWKTPNAGTTKSTWEAIEQYKTIFVEPKESNKLNQTIREYEDSIVNRKPGTTGAAFFCVCRGRVSEGLDFINRNGRCCVIIGIPFPPKEDVKVKLKKDYLDETAQKLTKDNPNAKPITGAQWYMQEASRAVNQAIGRIIRHRYDYGAVVLCDERFATQNQRQQLSRWLQPHVKVTSNFGEATKNLTLFYKGALQKFGVESEKVKPPALPKVQKDTGTNIQQNVYHEDFLEHRNKLSSQQDALLTEDHFAGNSEPSSSSVALQQYKRDFNDNNNNIQKRSITKSNSNLVDGKRNVVLNSFINPESQEKYNTTTATSSSSNQQSVKKDNAPKPSASQSTTGKKNSAEYLQKVKLTLTTEQYQEFKKLLIEFKKLSSSKGQTSSTSFKSLVIKLSELFTLNNPDLIDQFKDFISSKLHDKFDEVVKNYSKEQAEQKKRKQAPQQVTYGYDLLTGGKTKKIKPNTTDNTTSNANPNQNIVVIDEDGDEAMTDAKSTSSSTPNIAYVDYTCGRRYFIVNADTTDDNEDKPSLKCCICKDAAKEPATSKCGHLGCYACWNQWLQEKLECPMCRERVRLKSLTRLYL